MATRIARMLAMSLAGIALAILSSGDEAWAVESIESVDTAGIVGQHTSLALDASGFPVVSYNDATNTALKVLHCNDADCGDGDESIESVEVGNSGQLTSLALDASGFPVVSYLGQNNLKVLHCNDADCSGANESIESVDTAGTVGQFTSLALDGSGFPVVSYHDLTNGDLKVLHCNDADCSGANESIESVDTASIVGSHSSLALDASGFPVVSYFDDISDDLKLLHCNDADCSGGNESIESVPLMERIIKASANEGDVVLDAFCGCGTTLEASAKLKRRWIGLDVSPTACRVMGERLEGGGLVEGRDFTIRDMPKGEADLRRMPHFEFENWAVIALGGIPNRVKVGDYGIDGRLYVADVVKERKTERDLFGEIDNWYPIQVKQKDKAGRPDVDHFETAMRRDRRVRGYFIAFGFTKDAFTEIKRANKKDGLDIVPVTVKELLEHERVAV